MIGFLNRFATRNPDSSVDDGDQIVVSIRRHHGLTLHPGQIQAGRAMMEPVIAEMATGEGKTAASLLTIAQAAILGQRVFVATANDYLARRDADFAAPVLQNFQGTVGCLQANSSYEQRRAAYQAQVIYGTIKEFVFDHLRDRLAVADIPAGPSRSVPTTAGSERRSRIQPAAERLLIDEADSILIDEAVTPCLLSGPARPYDSPIVSCLAWGSAVARQLSEGTDYANVPGQGIVMTPEGRAKIGQSSLPPELEGLTLGDLFHWLELAIHAHRRFHRGVDYVVRNNEVVIVDESTGRVAEGRQWSAGIHQAIEAREGLSVTPANEARALLTIQEYVRRFRFLSGMTGTATEVRREFQAVFGLRVLPIPLHRPSLREHLPEIVRMTREEKLEAMLTEVQTMHSRGRPVLIGTRTIRASQELSTRMTDAGLPHVVLNALNPELESSIIAEAGMPGRITVATNMAGRGTDIRLQGDAAARGGLHVISSELHSAARIDRQLMGRCGRQGDPGSVRQFLSLDDDNLDEAWKPEQAARIRKNCRTHITIARQLRLAQRRLEHQAAERRSRLCLHQQQCTDLLRTLGLDPILNPVAESS